MAGRAICVFVAAGLLAGCAANEGGGSAGQVAASSQVAVNTPQSTGPGTVIHNRSGMQFPESVGEFQRLSASNPAGREMAAGYVMVVPGGGIVGLVNIYPSLDTVTPGSDSEQHTFNVVKSSLLSQHKDAKVIIPQRPVTITQQGQLRHGLETIVEYTDMLGGQRQLLHTELYSFAPSAHGFNIQYRFTYPAALNPGQNIQYFLEALPWTFGGLG